MSDRRRRLGRRMFDRLMGRAAAGRIVALLALRAREPSLASELESLLGHHDRAREEGFLHREPPPTEADDPAPMGSVLPATEPASEAEPDDLPPGTRVGRHVLERVVGRGGMGVVYRGRRIDDYSQTVAIKLMARMGSRAAVRRFHLERQLLALLAHPNIVRLLDGGEADDGAPYLVTEFVEGGSLADRARDGPLAPRAAAEILAPIVGAIAYAHDSGVIHRDLKPSNVLIAADGTPKVTDFGLASQSSRDGSMSFTRDGALVGTPGYMAPEQILGGAGRLEPAVDVYALGAILYFLLAGRPPHEGETVFETCRMALEREPEPLRKLRPSVPRDLETMAAVAMARDPSRRYATAVAMGDDLRRFLAGDPIAARPISRGEKVGRWLMRRRRFVAAAAVAALAALIGTAALQSRTNRELGRKNAILVGVMFRYAATMERLGRSGGYADPKLRADFASFSDALDEVSRAGGDEAEMVDVRYTGALAKYQLARTYQSTRESDKAIGYHAASIETLRDLARGHRDRPEIRYDLFRSLYCLADLVNARDSGRCVALHRESLDVIAALARDFPDDADYRDAEAAQHYNLGRVLIRERPSEAEVHLRESARIATDLCERPGANPRHRRYIAMAMATLALRLHQVGRVADAEREVKRSIHAGSLLIRDVPDEPVYRDEQAGRLSLLAQILADMGDLAGAEARLDEAVAMREMTIARPPYPNEFLEGLAGLLRHRAEVRLAMGKASEARADFAAAETHMDAFLAKLVGGEAKAARLLFAARLGPIDRQVAEGLLAEIPESSPSPDAKIARARALLALGRHAEARALATSVAPPRATESAALRFLAAAAEAGLGHRAAALARLAEGDRFPRHAESDCLFLARLRGEAVAAIESSEIKK